MKLTLEVKAIIGRSILIKELDLQTTVQGLAISRAGHVTYKVVYYHEGIRREEWIEEEEFSVGS